MKYVVTEDLSILVPRWLDLQSIPYDPAILDPVFFNSVLERLAESLRTRCFSDGTMAVDAKARHEFDYTLRRTRGTPSKDEIWICLDDPMLMQETERSFSLSITRCVSPDWSDLGRGSRPGMPGIGEAETRSVETQVSDCVDRMCAWEDLSTSSLVLVDDGAFDGHTIVMVMNEFAKYGFFFQRVNLGIATRRGEETIQAWDWPKSNEYPYATKKAPYVTNEIPYTGSAVKAPDIKEWVCERDFFPGVPLGGKVIADPASGQRRPSPLLVRGIPVRAQYLQDWGDIVNWASLTQGLNWFTLDILELSIDLWETIERACSRHFYVRDLPSVPQKVLSDAVLMGNSNILDELWVPLLAKMRDAANRRLFPA